MDTPLTSRRSAPGASDGHVFLEPARLLGIIANVCVMGGILTIVSIVVPHADSTYDAQFTVLGVLFVLIGAALHVAARRSEPGIRVIHAAALLLSLGVLTLTWLGMRDVGGVQAVLLFLPLALSASIGPLRWSMALFLLQVGGYAVVLATADPVLGLDRGAQWTTVTIGLVVALVYQNAVRGQLAQAHDLELEVREEQELQRRQHAERLERVNEELHEANELKDRFVAMASHELRTPLTSISGFASTMTATWDDLDDGDKRRFVGIIEEQSARLGRLVEDLLTLSRIESRRLETHAQPIELCSLIERTVRMLQLDEEVEVACELDVLVVADEDYVQQVLVNYLGNARSYGSAPIVVSALREGDWVDIEVADAGPGVPTEFVPDLFTRFTRGPNGLAPGAPGGTGLGLSIVDGIARAHGGRAWYRPNAPTGARFGVRIPAAPDDVGEPVSDESHAGSSAAWRSPTSAS